MALDAGPTARALLALELVQAIPGITADRLADKLGVSERTTRLVGSTNNPAWYAEQLVGIPAPYRIVICPELQQAARVLGQRLLTAGDDLGTDGPPSGPSVPHHHS